MFHLEQIHVYGCWNVGERADYYVHIHWQPYLGLSHPRLKGSWWEKRLGKSMTSRTWASITVSLGWQWNLMMTPDLSRYTREIWSRRLLNDSACLDCKPKATPLLVGTLATLDTQPRPIPTSDKEFMKNKDYKAVLGSLNHIANGTCPDFAFTMNYLQCFTSDPGPIHWNRAIHVLGISQRDDTIQDHVWEGN